jgi:ketosteroid isomerase-like protein
MPNVLEIQPSSATERIALSYFTLLVRRDMDHFGEIWTDDAVQQVPFTPEGLGEVVPTAFKGRDAIVSHYRTVTKNRREHVFWIDQIHPTSDSNCIIIEAHARSIIGETNAVYENSYVCVFHLRGGKIAVLKEYANPLPVMRAFRGAFEKARGAHE